MKTYLEGPAALKNSDQMQQSTDVVSSRTSSLGTPANREMKRQVACVAPLKYAVCFHHTILTVKYTNRCQNSEILSLGPVPQH